MEIDEIIEILPSPPEYNAKAIEWPNVTLAAAYMNLTPQGFLQCRQRYMHAYEHKHKNNVYVYFPLWLRLHQLYQATR